MSNTIFLQVPGPITYPRIDFLVFHPSYSLVYLSGSLHTCLFLCSLILLSISITAQYLESHVRFLHDKPRKITLLGPCYSFSLPCSCLPHSFLPSPLVSPCSCPSSADGNVDNNQNFHLKYAHIHFEEDSVCYYSNLTPDTVFCIREPIDYTRSTLTTRPREKKITPYHQTKNHSRNRSDKVVVMEERLTVNKMTNTASWRPDRQYIFRT